MDVFITSNFGQIITNSPQSIFLFSKIIFFKFSIESKLKLSYILVISLIKNNFMLLSKTSPNHPKYQLTYVDFHKKY